ncbi:hypothetical protein [Ferruginibacter sp. HRS2-29]|uniref:hypothetical protein n=1 Tax=Ferruginibacter sp. HRS2-29 TaxID=2487334 RepID=UPI0020CC1EE7|nr:hypothetical protein [Ferruginibacter sp. HRS2-29]MCP9750804.1 hypothetical protein [Ferruginibacter sp. HRS2-29]
MKKIIPFFILLFLYNHAEAQKKHGDALGFKFSGGATLAVPSSNLPLWSVGAGVDLLMQYGITHDFAITGDAGFTNLFGRRNGIKNYTIVPVRVGARFFATPKFYIAAKTGVGFLKVKGIDGATALAYTVGGGYMVAKQLDLGVAYDGYSKNGTIGMVAFRAGYFFNND